MKTLQLSDSTARRLYPKALPEFKAILEETYGKDFFSQKITDRIKTFEDACEVLGQIPTNQHILLSYNGVDKDMIAAQIFIKLTLIAKALNEGWQPDWTDSNQYKYFPWFDLSSASGFRFNVAGYDFTLSDTPARLCYKSRELAEYAGKQFIDLYKEFIN